MAKIRQKTNEIFPNLVKILSNLAEASPEMTEILLDLETFAKKSLVSQFRFWGRRPVINRAKLVFGG